VRQAFCKYLPRKLATDHQAAREFIGMGSASAFDRQVANHHGIAQKSEEYSRLAAPRQKHGKLGKSPSGRILGVL